MKSCITHVCNDRYFDQARFVFWQLELLNLSGVDLVLCSADDLAAPCAQSGVKFQPIDVVDFVEGLPSNGRLKHYTYWRLPAFEVLSARYDRILYLDTDVFLAGLALGDLLQLDLQGAPLAAVRDVHQRNRKSRTPREFTDLDLPNAPYFNAGVLLIDGTAWREGHVFAKIQDLCATHPQSLHCHDQSLLNLVFYNNWLELSPVWNWQLSYRINLLPHFLGAELIHIAGARKLWDMPGGDLPRSYVKTYHAYCRAYGLPILEGPAPTRHSLRRPFWKNWIYLRSTMQDMQRFSHDLDSILWKDAP